MKFVLAAVVCFFIMGCTEQPTYQAGVEQDGYELYIFGASNWDEERVFYYEIRKDRKVIKDLTLCDARHEKPSKLNLKDKEKCIIIFARSSREVIAKIEKP